MYLCLERNFFESIAWHDFGGWEVLQSTSASWRLRNARDLVLRLENHRTDDVDFSVSLKAWEPGMLRERENHCSRSICQVNLLERKHKFSFSPNFYSTQAFKGMDYAHSLRTKSWSLDQLWIFGSLEGRFTNRFLSRSVWSLQEGALLF